MKRTRFGVGLYALGSDPDGAYANGMPLTRYRIATYALAGMFYAAAGLYVSAQTGSADPLVGRPLLLSMFTAVVLGGTWLGGGRGGCVGTVFAAMTLMVTVNILLVLNVSAFFTTIAEAAILILAVLGSSIGKHSAAHHCARYASQWIRAVRTGTRVKDGGDARRVNFEVANFQPIENTELKGRFISDWIERNREWVKYVVPAYALFFVVVAITGFVYGPSVLASANFYSSLLTLTLFLAVLGLGQGAVILTGGLDLSMPWLITLSGVLLTGLTLGANGAAAWAVPLVLGVGLLVGLFNGLGVVVLGLPPIVVTLAANGLLQGLTLIYCNGSPQGWAPSVDQRIHKRPLRSAVARRVERAALSCGGAVALASHTVRTARVCGRQLADRGKAGGCAGWRDADRRVLPLGPVFRDRRGIACRFQQPGVSRHGRSLPAAVDCSRCRGWCADHGRARALPRRVRRSTAAHRARHAARGNNCAASCARHH